MTGPVLIPGWYSIVPAVALGPYMVPVTDLYRPKTSFNFPLGSGVPLPVRCDLRKRYRFDDFVDMERDQLRVGGGSVRLSNSSQGSAQPSLPVPPLIRLDQQAGPSSGSGIPGENCFSLNGQHQSKKSFPSSIVFSWGLNGSTSLYWR